MNKEFIENVLQLWGNPFFAQSFLEFSAGTQQVGLEAARRSWAINHREDTFPGNALGLFERMIAFYSDLGFAPKSQHEELVKENERLRKENEFLKNTLKELNLKIFAEGSLQVQRMWRETAHKQMEMSAEIAKNFLDLFKQQSGD